jgi:hypothetical protein
METCALCCENKDLQDSHFMPRGLYRIARDSSSLAGSSEDPVIITTDGSYRTSKQIKSYLLCKDCEQRFSRLGEDLIISECLHENGSFKLRDKLNALYPTWTDKQSSWFAEAALTNVDINRYRYFAASIFWRGSVWPRKYSGSEAYKGSLGLKYQEEFQHFLNEESRFPSNAFLVIFVASESAPLAYTTAPSVSNESGYHIHKFHIPGIEFRMFLGNKINYEFKFIFDKWSTNVMFVLMNSQMNPSINHILKLARNSPPKGKLRSK